MPTLENVDGGTLAALPGYYSMGVQAGAAGTAARASQLNAMNNRRKIKQEGERQEAEVAAKAAQMAERRRLTDEVFAGKEGAMQAIIADNPDYGKLVYNVKMSDDKAAAAKLDEMSEKGGALALSAMNTSNPTIRRQMYMTEAKTFMDAGDEPAAKNLMEMANLAVNDPERFEAEANKDILLSKNTKLIDLANIGSSAVKPVVVAKGGSVYDPATKTFTSASPASSAPEIPKSLLKGLSPSVAEKGSAAYTAAGGGKDGMKAFNEAVIISKEDERRQQLPDLLSTRYPYATEEEVSQIKAAIDSAPSVESGLKSADIIREQQRTNTKGKEMAERSLVLVENILGNNELSDVVGSYEGQDDIIIPRSDKEAEAIADIKELTNILTVPNMKLMSGILSETDLKLLMSIAGGGLNRMRGEDRFIKDATDIAEKLRKAVGASSTGATKNSRLEELRKKAGMNK